MNESIVRQGVRRVGIEAERLRLRLSPSPRALDAEQALAALPETPHVLFLCHGNICRSPLAERYARKRASADLARFDSAGFVQQDGRQSPETAQIEAAAHGVDLTTHRSTRVTWGMVAESDLLVVMDVRNYRRLQREFPKADDDAYFLTAFDPEGGVTIDDPYGEGSRDFERAYDEVTTAVENLVTALEMRRRA